MPTRYHKRYHPLPGVHLNMSSPRHLSSVTLGHPRLLSMTIGDGGTHWLNANLPGGYSWRSGKRGGQDHKTKPKTDTKTKHSNQHTPDSSPTDEQLGAEKTRHSAKAGIFGFVAGAISFGTPIGMGLLHFMLHAI